MTNKRIMFDMKQNSEKPHKAEWTTTEKNRNLQMLCRRLIMNHDPKLFTPGPLFNSDHLSTLSPFNISRAFHLLDEGKCLTRVAWNGKSIIFIAYTVVKDGDNTKYEKCIQISDAEGNREWLPRNEDIFTIDWIVVSI